MANNEYFAAKENPEEVAATILDRANKWYGQVHTNGLLLKIKESWMAYHGAYYSSVDDGHKIVFSGEEGELVNIPINHYRNIANHMLVMITANRPTMEARSINTDYKSVVQTQLANGLLDYYMREKRLEKYLKRSVEYAIALSAGYVKMEWDATSGEIYDYNDATGSPIYEGDVKFSNLSPLDVVFDNTKETDDHDWVVCRSFKNRFDLAAKFPELKDKIVSMPTKTEVSKYRFDFIYNYETDDVPVYEFYHKHTAAMPDGRYMLFLDSDLVLYDGPMPYRNLPVYRISCADILGTPWGYTPMYDVLPIQDAINAMYSTILSNNTAHGVQNILMPLGSQINPRSIGGALNIIEYNPAAGKPEPMQFTNSSPETYKLLEMLVREAETISGVNSVARGNPEASLKSGAALALVQSMSLQFISGLQQSYVQLIEDVGTGLISMLKDFASVPRVASIVGKSNRAYMKEFVGEDLSSINRVVVDVGNPLSRSTAGRVQMAEQLLQMGIIKTPEQYMTVMNTGNLHTMTENTERELNLIRDENERLVIGESVLATSIDEHGKHIKEHRGVLADSSLREDPDLVSRVLDHIQEHIEHLRNTDPALLSLLGEQSIGPQGGTPPATQEPQAESPDNMGQSEEVMQQPQPMQDAQAGMPNLPTPPAPFENMPTQATEMLPQ
jgi:hypothetical protein